MEIELVDTPYGKLPTKSYSVSITFVKFRNKEVREAVNRLFTFETKLKKEAAQLARYEMTANFPGYVQWGSALVTEV